MKLAQINFPSLEGAVGGNAILKSNDLGAIVSVIIPYAFAVAGFLLVIYLIVGGLEFIFSMGEPKKTAMARGKITNALIGFLVVFAAYLIVQVVAYIFSISDIGNMFI